MVKSKRCSDCKRELPVGAFHKNRSRKDGLCYRCRRCRLAARREYHSTEHGRGAHRGAVRKYRGTFNGQLGIVFDSMNQRCNNPNTIHYKHYGGRGIQNKFESLDDFREYVINGLKVDPQGLQIDRIDNDGHYEKGNIRFVTAKENCNNRRKRTKKIVSPQE